MEVVVGPPPPSMCLQSLWCPFLPSQNHFGWKRLPAFVWSLPCQLDHSSKYYIQLYLIASRDGDCTTLYWSASALSHSHMKVPMTFVGELFFSTNDTSLHWKAAVSGTVIGGTVVPDPVAAPASWFLGSAHPVASTLAVQTSWDKQQCCLKIALFVIDVCIFKCFLLTAWGFLSPMSPCELPSEPCWKEGAQWEGGMGLSSPDFSLLVKPVFPGCVDGTPGVAWKSQQMW